MVNSVYIPIIAALVGALAGAAGAGLAAYYSANMAFRNVRVTNSANSAFKQAEFKWAALNLLRECMADFHSYGTIPEADPTTEREFYKLGTKIELLLDPNDPDSNQLQDIMYEYLAAKTTVEKYRLNPRYLSICHRILKRQEELLLKEMRSCSEA